MAPVLPMGNIGYLPTTSLDIAEMRIQQMTLNNINSPAAQLAVPNLTSSNPFLPLLTFQMPKLNIDFSSFTSSFAGRSGMSTISGKSGDLLSIARKYIGFNEKDGSYLKFTNGRREAWCADFVSYCAKEAGLNGPNTSSVEGIRQWGKANGRYSTSKAKVGDAVIFKNGMSHTGIIESISGNTITCIEGNTSDKVARRTYSINDPKISGFVSLA